MPYTKETIKLGDEKITFKKGALRSQLKLNKNQDLSVKILEKLKKVETGSRFMLNNKDLKKTPLMSRRINFALTLMKKK